MTRQEILEIAIKYVTKDRTAVHGEPEDNFATIAKFQEVYLSAITKNRIDPTLQPHDVAILNILQKIARIIQTPHHLDHWIDIAGYAACGGQCVNDPNSPEAVMGNITGSRPTATEISNIRK